MTLHQAIEKILKETGHPLSAKEIAYLVNSQKLYVRGDGMQVPSSQIHARVNHYPTIFEKDIYGNIKLLKH